MKTITFESNYGNFDYRFTASVPDGGSEYLQKQGLANIAYRVAGSAVDKALGIKDRKTVAFSTADGERVNVAVSKKIAALEAKENGDLKGLGLSFAVIGEHVFGAEAAPSKEATELWTQVQTLKDDEFLAACGKLGINSDDYDDDSGILACKKYLQAVKKTAMEQAKALFATEKKG